MTSYLVVIWKRIWITKIWQHFYFSRLEHWRKEIWIWLEFVNPGMVNFRQNFWEFLLNYIKFHLSLPLFLSDRAVDQNISLISDLGECDRPLDFAHRQPPCANHGLLSLLGQNWRRINRISNGHQIVWGHQLGK